MQKKKVSVEEIASRCWSFVWVCVGKRLVGCLAEPDFSFVHVFQELFCGDPLDDVSLFGEIGLI